MSRREAGKEVKSQQRSRKYLFKTYLLMGWWDGEVGRVKGSWGGLSGGGGGVLVWA